MRGAVVAVGGVWAGPGQPAGMAWAQAQAGDGRGWTGAAQDPLEQQRQPANKMRRKRAMAGVTPVGEMLVGGDVFAGDGMGSGGTVERKWWGGDGEMTVLAETERQAGGVNG